jgi:hypothetical protein
MLCAHTVRRLKPGTFDQFLAAFRPDGEELPRGWLRFHALRGLENENEIVTFGFFDGTLDELERSQRDGDYQSRRDAIEPYVESVVANGIYEVAVSWEAEGVPASRL